MSKYDQYKTMCFIFNAMSLECIASVLGVSKDTVVAYEQQYLIEELGRDEE